MEKSRLHRSRFRLGRLFTPPTTQPRAMHNLPRITEVTKRTLLGISLIVGSCLAGCLASSQPSETSYEVRGVVREVRAATMEVIIDHERIPGFMDAMTMPFVIRDKHELDGLNPGDAVSFRLTVSPSDAWIQEIRKHGRSSDAPALPRRPSKELALKVGDPMPDFCLVNEQGAPVRLEDYKGHVLVLTFIFTNCRMPTLCPLISSQMAAAQNTLIADPNAPKNWRILSITIDPNVDQPEVLKAYAMRLGSNRDHWQFATGSLESIKTLASRCGLTFWSEGGTIVHDLRTLIVGPDGRVRTVFSDQSWTPQMLVAEIRSAAGSPTTR
jgi:protein SCO1/2